MLLMKHWFNSIEKIGTEEQVKDFLYGIYKYGIEEENYVSNDQVVNIALDNVFTQIDAMQESYERDKTNGRKGGRPCKIDNKRVWEMARNGKSGIEISEELGVPKTTIYSSDGWRQRKNINYEN